MRPTELWWRMRFASSGSSREAADYGRGASSYLGWRRARRWHRSLFGNSVGRGRPAQAYRPPPNFNFCPRQLTGWVKTRVSAGFLHRISTRAFENSWLDGPGLQAREFHQVIGVESRRKDGPIPYRRRIFGNPLRGGKLSRRNCHRVGRPAPGKKFLRDVCQRQ